MAVNGVEIEVGQVWVVLSKGGSHQCRIVSGAADVGWYAEKLDDPSHMRTWFGDDGVARTLLGHTLVSPVTDGVKRPAIRLGQMWKVQSGSTDRGIGTIGDYAPGVEHCWWVGFPEATGFWVTDDGTTDLESESIHLVHLVAESPPDALIFPDISEIDSALGRVYLRKAFIHPAAVEVPATAGALLTQAAKHMADRAATYDKPEGERSMAATVAAFNAHTGRNLTEAEGWLFMVNLKIVRDNQRPDAHRDSCEDLVAYGALYGESRLKGGDK